MTEKECYEKMKTTIKTRDELLRKKCGDNFIQRITEPDTRDWYTQNILKLDLIIIDCANKVSKIRKWGITFSHFTELAKCEKINDWYTEQVIKENALLKEKDNFDYLNFVDMFTDSKPHNVYEGLLEL